MKKRAISTRSRSVHSLRGGKGRPRWAAASSKTPGVESAARSFRSLGADEAGRELRHLVRRAEADRDGPGDGRRAKPSRGGGGDERGHADLVRVPVPGAAAHAHWIEVMVRRDAVHVRQHAGDERRVRRIRHGGQDADDALGPDSLTHQPAEVGDLQSQRVRPGVAFRFQAVDRDHHDVTGGAVRVRREEHGRQQEEE